MSNCEICDGMGWQITEQGAVRCGCVDRKRQAEIQTPLDPDSVSMAVKALEAINFLPTGRAAQTVIGDALATMCPSVEALRYVVRRACALYKTWDKCGISGLRQIVCSRFVPADGIESGPTELFPEGLPSETKHDPLALPPGFTRALPSGQLHSADAKCEQMVETLAEKQSTSAPTKKLTYSDRRRASAFKSALLETITAPCDRPNPKPPEAPTRQYFTQADIDAAVAELHASKREEVAK